MPTQDQLTRITPADGDGSTTSTADDGTTTVDWPDGTQRVDYQDGSSMVTFPDGAVLNLYADGSRTLNDAAGNALDPDTGGAPTAQEGIAAPEIGPDRVKRILDGDERLAGIDQAKEFYDAAKDALEGELDPVALFEQWLKMVIEVVKALETEERGAYFRGWSYGLVYGSLDLGAPPEPTFTGSLGGTDQDALDQQYWDRGVTAASDALGAADGVELRNRVLLRIAANGGRPEGAVREIYVATCDHNDDTQLWRAYEDILGWPEPVGA